MTDTIEVKFRDDEFGLLRKTFKNNNDLLKAVRKSLFQFELTDNDRKLLEVFKGEDLKELLRKVFLPSLENDISIMWEEDKFDRLGGDMPFGIRQPEHGAICVKARKMAFQYCTYEFEKLFGNNFGTISFKEFEDTEDKDDKEIYLNFLARGEIVDKIRNFLKEVKIMANTKKMTKEEMLEASKKDSLK